VVTAEKAPAGPAPAIAAIGQESPCQGRIVPLSCRPVTLLRSTYVVGGSTLLSRVLGFVRDMVFAVFFGAGAAMDVFVIAFQIPNFLRRLFAEGAFSQAFVPVLSEYHGKRSPAEVKDLIDRTAGRLAGVLFAVTLVGVVGAPLLILVFSSGFRAEPEKYALAVEMLRITFPYLFFISLTAFAGAVLNTYGRFAIPAITPVILNLCLIGGVVWLEPMLGGNGLGLAWAVFIAGVAQLGFQLPFLARLGVLPRLRWGEPHEGVRRILRLMMPALFGSSVAQLNLLIDRHIASYLQTGSMSWLWYSDRLMEFPLGVFAIALATVILPGLSRRHTEQAPQAFSETIDWALRLTCVIVIPAGIAMFVLAGPILATLFQHGEFTAYDTRMTTYSLAAYAVGLLGFTLVKVLAPAYFARQDTRTPVRVGVVAMVANIVLNLIIVVPMVKVGFVAPHMGLVIATGLAAFINAGLLYRGLRRLGVYTPGPGWSLLARRVALANLGLAAALWWIAGPIDGWLVAHWFDRAVHLGVCLVAGTIVYFAILWMSGLRYVELRAPA
jgi:putative peptidoglycan lipid II flippase